MMYTIPMPQSAKSDFGKALSKIRKDKGLTQSELAEVLECSQQMVDYYERKTVNPTAKTVLRIAKALNIPPNDLNFLPQKSQKKPGPPSRIQQLVDQLSELPKNKQKTIIEMLEGFLEKTAS